MFNVQFTQQGSKSLRKLPKKIQQRIIRKIQYFASQGNPAAFAKPLINLPPATHRFRVGSYRITFYVSSNSLIIDKISHRKEVYL